MSGPPILLHDDQLGHWNITGGNWAMVSALTNTGTINIAATRSLTHSSTTNLNAGTVLHGHRYDGGQWWTTTHNFRGPTRPLASPRAEERGA
ncbi:MAG: hypothetical protein IPM46_01440 [Flavobacteriales bacterium]|nr:hypothetical protein [Flavobacteriales bacterium]